MNRMYHKNGSSIRRGMAFLVVAVLLLLQANALFANVTLVDFKATALPDSTIIRVEWETASEINTVAFTLSRRPEGGSYEQIHTTAAVDSAGHQYMFDDENREPGVLYQYLLEDIDQNGTVTSHGPVSAGVGLVLTTATPTPTVTVRPTNPPPTSGPGAPPTATRQFTNTPPAAPTATARIPTAVLPPTIRPPATPTLAGPAQVTTPTPVGGIVPAPTLPLPTPFAVATAEVSSPEPGPSPTILVQIRGTQAGESSPTPRVRAEATAAVFEAVSTRPGVAATAAAGASSEVAGRSTGSTLAIGAVALILAAGVGALVYYLSRARR